MTNKPNSNDGAFEAMMKKLRAEGYIKEQSDLVDTSGSKEPDNAELQKTDENVAGNSLAEDRVAGKEVAEAVPEEISSAPYNGEADTVTKIESESASDDSVLFSESMENDLQSEICVDKLPKKKKKHRIRKVLLVLLLLLVGLVVIALLTVTILYFVGKSGVVSSVEKLNIPESEEYEIEDDGKTVIVDGVKYRYNDNIANILCIGVDKPQLGTVDNVIGTGGQADAVYMVALDTKTAEYNVICISRDSVVDVAQYSSSGKYIGTTKDQLCLSYAYGNGRKTSAENTVRSVSRLFYDMPINTYFAMDFYSLGLLTDKVGGVAVPEYDDFGNKTGKTLSITGDNAETYLRRRNTKLLDSNNARMNRHIDFLTAFSSKCISNTVHDWGFPLDLYDTSKDYTCTNLGASKITYLTASIFSKQSDININYRRVEGTVRVGEDSYAEYVVDDKKLMYLILDVYYDKVEE